MSHNHSHAIIGFRTQALLQGDVQVSTDPELVITTMLGSCVAACMWDEVAGIGGMNHFLLPGNDPNSQGAVKEGVHAMELLVNGLIQAGASRDRMKVKLLGGSKMFNSRIDIGAKNAEFAMWFVRNEGFELVDCCLGGQRGRNIRFWPVGGRIQRRFMNESSSVMEETSRASERRRAVKHDDNSGEVQLF
ncbi:chemotaxis protein CheD [Shimia isoporae]|uniref:Probable chemoreceptor glutamine deamidase CheD n=1 Tax=Shimia isoporae TaxID=647720 RepID=A0A4R1NJN8_9RHOB|nr:chemotaxis protein CheD [Shimia isoporae]TCL08235.1 chemotaxis protein CheD [Shimia isoporae]